MRLLNLYVVLDERAKNITGPIVHDYNAVPIVRQIQEAVNGGKGLVANSPQDFTIKHIGMIDEETGLLYTTAGEQLTYQTETVAQAMALRAPSN